MHVITCACSCAHSMLAPPALSCTRSVCPCLLVSVHAACPSMLVDLSPLCLCSHQHVPTMHVRDPVASRVYLRHPPCSPCAHSPTPVDCPCTPAYCHRPPSTCLEPLPSTRHTCTAWHTGHALHYCRSSPSSALCRRHLPSQYPQICPDTSRIYLRAVVSSFSSQHCLSLVSILTQPTEHLTLKVSFAASTHKFNYLSKFFLYSSPSPLDDLV